MIPRPPKEILMRRKKESLLDDFAKMEAGPQVERGLASGIWADSVERGQQMSVPSQKVKRERKPD